MDGCRAGSGVGVGLNSPNRFLLDFVEQLILFLIANNDLLFGITFTRAKCQASLLDLFPIILIQTIKKLIYTGQYSRRFAD